MCNGKRFTSEHIQGFQPWAAPCNSYLWELVLSLQKWVSDEWAATWMNGEKVRDLHVQQHPQHRGLPSSCCCKPCDKKHKGRPTYQYFNVVGSDWRLSSFVHFRLNNWYQCGCGFALAPNIYLKDDEHFVHWHSQSPSFTCILCLQPLICSSYCASIHVRDEYQVFSLLSRRTERFERQPSGDDFWSWASWR